MSPADGSGPVARPHADPPARPLLPGFFRVIPMGDDSLQLRSAGRVVRLSGPGVGTYGPRLLSALDGRSTVTELGSRLQLDPETVEHLIGRLHAGGVLDEGGPGNGSRAPDTATSEFYRLAGHQAVDVRAALASARVLFVGLGPTARTAARNLAVAAVGALVLADGGKVTAMDQAILPGEPGDAGRPRSRVVAAQCLRAAKVSSPEARPPVVAMEGGTPIGEILRRSAPVSLAVVEVDESGERAEQVNAACSEAGVPALYHESTTLEGTVGPTVLASFPGCYACLVSRRASHLRYYDEHLAYQRCLRSGEVPARQPALLAASAALLGGIVAAEALAVLAGSGSATTGGVLTADFRTLEVRREALVAVPGCRGCDTNREDTVSG